MFQAIFLVVAFVAIGDTSLGDSQEVNVTQTILQLQASLEELKGSVKELNASRAELKSIVENLTAENKEQAIKIKEQDMEIQHLDHKLSHKFSVLRGMGSQSLDVASENRISISQITERVSNLEKSDGEVVGFSTHLTVPGNFFYPTSEVIVPFNEIITNIGGHFSSNRHKFRCPVDGYYLFMYSINSGYIRQQGSPRRDETNGKLVKDGVEVNRVFCDTDTEENIQCHLSNSAIVLCRRNSDVYVVTWGSETKIYGANRLNTFSGFLIKSI